MTRSFFTYTSILLPILYIYLSPIDGVDLGTFLVLVFGVIMLADKRIKKNLSMPTSLIVYLTYAAFCTILGLFGTHYSTPFNIIMRLSRLIVVLIVMIGYGYSTYYDESKFVDILKKTSIVIALYAILQYIVYSFTGVELTNTFGPTKQEIIRDLDVSIFNNVYRPPSVFSEPSGVTYFLTPYLCYLLFSNKQMTKSQIIEVLIISAGIITTTSGQGLIILMVCWGIWLLLQGIKARNFMSTILFFVAALLLISNSNIDYTIQRIFTQDEMNAVEARSGGYEELKGRPILELVVGSGYGNYYENTYYTSIADIIFCTGIIGMILVFLMYCYFFIKGQLYQKILVICSFILMSSGGVFTASFLCLYLPLLLTKRDQLKVTNTIKNNKLS